jgi:hypothetical protein
MFYLLGRTRIEVQKLTLPPRGAKPGKPIASKSGFTTWIAACILPGCPSTPIFRPNLTLLITARKVCRSLYRPGPTDCKLERRLVFDQILVDWSRSLCRGRTGPRQAGSGTDRGTVDAVSVQRHRVTLAPRSRSDRSHL